MRASLRRVGALYLRYLYLHKRSMTRLLELIFWPVMQLLLWGFLSLYLQRLAGDSPMAQMFTYLINATIFWDILFRSQMGMSTSFMEDLWTQNIINILISPVRMVEWLGALCLYSLTKTVVITGILAMLALLLYHFSLIDAAGLALIPMGVNLAIFGWSLGLFATGLLIRWGLSVEALVWGLPFLLQPVSAVFYPLDVLPRGLQYVSLCLPGTYIFESARAIVRTGQVPWHNFAAAFGLNVVYFILGALFFMGMYRRARENGRLGRLSMD